MAVEMRQQSVAELLQLDEQLVGGPGVRRDAKHGALLVRKLRPLVQYEHLADNVSGDEEELLVPVGGQLLETFVEKQGADRIPGSARRQGRGSCLFDLLQGFQEIVGLPDLQEEGRQALLLSSCGSFGECRKQGIALFDQLLPLGFNIR